MRNQRRAEKISLSHELEGLLFAQPLKKRELEALKERCNSYQIGAPRKWSGDVYGAYSKYFGLLSALKIKSVLQELDAYGYFTNIENIFDFGAGTLGGTLGAIDFFKEQKKKLNSIYVFDTDTRPIDWGTKEYASFFPKRPAISKPSNLENTLVIAVDVFNEMGLMNQKEQIDSGSSWFKEIESWIEKATDTTLIVLLEPASKVINRNFLTLRNILKDKITILAPCTHQMNCPALLTDDWCHEERVYKAPSAYWNLVRELGFRRNLLQFSMLCLGKKNSCFEESFARVVSRPLKTKGRCEKWLCSQGKRWKASVLTRRQKEEELHDFFEACRGDVLDSRLPELPPPKLNK